MLKPVGIFMAKVGDATIKPACQVFSQARDYCAECAQKFRWMPRVTSWATSENSRQKAVVEAALDISQETIQMLCDACWRVESTQDLSWLDSLDCECLCLVAERMGFSCHQCITIQLFSLCSTERHDLYDCEDDVMKQYNYRKDNASILAGLCDTKKNEPYIFNACDEPELLRRFLKSLWFSKTKTGTADDLVGALRLLFPDDEVVIVDHDYGKAWVSLNRSLTNTEVRMRELFASVLPLPLGVSFRILEPIEVE